MKGGWHSTKKKRTNKKCAPPKEYLAAEKTSATNELFDANKQEKNESCGLGADAIL